MTSAETRATFLNYFKEHGHQIVPSASLVPLSDQTLLFTNAGMNQFKDLFLAKEQRDYRRATTAQKCMRVSGKHNDLDNVGPSLRHHTFFEMLGNFSFGDYFKADAIPFAWSLLTDVWQLPPEHLYATVYAGEDGIPRDAEAYSLWQQLIPDERIIEMGAVDNFWSMGDTGPCGRCSEIHFYRGDDFPCTQQTCKGLDCSCDRYVEIWNNVFMEFDRQTDGRLIPLPRPSIDTGMGLERIVAVMQGKLSNYDTDLFTPLLSAIGTLAGTSYGPLAGRTKHSDSDVSLRVIADHLRAMTFLIADGIVPSNEWRGYVLRKIMRRAMRHGKKLGHMEPFLHNLINVVVEEMSDAYPELRANSRRIIEVVRREEEQFDKVLTEGLPRIEAALSEAESNSKILSGDDVFRLYDTFGLPIDFIEDLASTKNVAVDRIGFDAALELQRSRARSNSQFGTEETLQFNVSDDNNPSSTEDTFVGYTDTTHESNVRFLFESDGNATDTLGAGKDGFVVLDTTPFYLEAGGQVSDTGNLITPDSTVEVRDVVRPLTGWPRLHAVTVSDGILHVGDNASATVNIKRRDDIRRNHTATHLLHAALRSVLGNHVKQAGSLVAPDRLRFDVSHYEPITTEQLFQIEQIVNSRIIENQTVTTEERPTSEAIADGAMALFGEKYGDRVRVVSVPGVSIELCGGTHCVATGDIGTFVITQEGGVAAGVRRIEAVTGGRAIQLVQERQASLAGMLQVLGTTTDEALPALTKLQTDARRLSREVQQLKVAAAANPSGPSSETPNTVEDIAGIQVMRQRVSGLEQAALRSLADTLRERLQSGVVVLAAETDKKVVLTVTVTKDLTDRLHAGKIVQVLAPIVGGRGGGRVDFAQAGGRDTQHLDKVLKDSSTVIQEMLQKQ